MGENAASCDCAPELDWSKHPFVIDLPGQNGTVHDGQLMQQIQKKEFAAV